MDVESIGDRVYWHRDQRDWTQEELAQEAGISATTVSHIESGAKQPRMNTIRRLARAFGVSTDELLHGKELVPPKVETPPSPEPSLNDVLEEERRLDNEAALAVLFRGLARRARLIVQGSRREGPSAELGEEVAALHKEANALYRLRGRRDIVGRASEELAEAEAAYEEVEGTIQAMLRQDVEAADEERDTARRFRPDAGDASKRRGADAS